LSLRNEEYLQEPTLYTIRDSSIVAAIYFSCTGKYIYTLYASIIEFAFVYDIRYYYNIRKSG